ncbi:MAG: nuclease [Lachnospiraceae bacterium]|jgi:hypothetical protein|nr:nuclease [Lachnospiraceae bacterium]
MDKERLHQEDLQRIRGFRLIDDDFMNACFDGNIEATELILRIILNKPDITVKRVTTQKVMKNLLGRDIWLDVDADDAEGITYDIEIQRSDKGANRKRARYHSSIMDARLLKHGEDFSDLPESYVIFITEHDVIGRNLPIYFIERKITNTGELFQDGEHIIYVNGEDKNGATELGKLMHDFFCTDPDDMHYKALADKVRYFKEDEKGVAKMCKVMEDMRQSVAQETEWNTKVKSVVRWIEMGLTYDQIAKGEDLSVEQVEEIASQQKL